MPFITPERRAVIHQDGGLAMLHEVEPGDRCYVFYKQMVEKWRANPRWTTAHNLCAEFLERAETMSADDMIASRLAWEVFFNIYVLPYEQRKRDENGDI